MSLDQATLRAYRERWQAVDQVNNAERQRDTVTERWHKLNSLLRMAAGLGLYAHRIEAETAIPHQRWNRLRQMYLDGNREESL